MALPAALSDQSRQGVVIQVAVVSGLSEVQCAAGVREDALIGVLKSTALDGPDDVTGR